MPVEVPPPAGYQLDPAGSRIAFAITHGIGARANGTFAILSGTVNVAENPGESTVSAVIDAASINTGNRLRDSEVRSGLFLKTSDFPTMTFTSHAVRQLGGNWLVTGTLTAHGVTAPVEFTIAELSVSGDEFRATATARVDRFDFGVKAARGLLGKNLDLTLTIIARRS